MSQKISQWYSVQNKSHMNCHGIGSDPCLAMRNQGPTTSAQLFKCLITFLVTSRRCIKYVKTHLQVHCHSLSCLCLPLLMTLVITKVTIIRILWTKLPFLEPSHIQLALVRSWVHVLLSTSHIFSPYLPNTLLYFQFVIYPAITEIAQE